MTAAYFEDHPTDPEKVILRKPPLDQGADYERGFIDGMQKQMQSSVDKAAQALAQTQEPVAWKPTEADYEEWCDRHELDDRAAFEDAASLYLTAAPPQRTWVDLTDEDVMGLCRTFMGQFDKTKFIKATEDKIKELNT